MSLSVQVPNEHKVSERLGARDCGIAAAPRNYQTRTYGSATLPDAAPRRRAGQAGSPPWQTTRPREWQSRHPSETNGSPRKGPRPAAGRTKAVVPCFRAVKRAFSDGKGNLTVGRNVQMSKSAPGGQNRGLVAMLSYALGVIICRTWYQCTRNGIRSDQAVRFPFPLPFKPLCFAYPSFPPRAVCEPADTIRANGVRKETRARTPQPHSPNSNGRKKGRD